VISLKIVSISLLGDKDAGKSTLIGEIATLTKSVSEARINEAKRESKKLGKEFEPAFILDAFKEEREKGLTIDTTTVEVSYKDVVFQFIDVPGHESLIKNMLTGASNAEMGVVVISAKQGEGLTRETKLHIKLANMLGIDKFVFFINKMDTNGYSKEKAIEIWNETHKFLLPFINDIKYIGFVPGSALNGDNILKRSRKISWYKGDSLMERLYDLVKNDKKIDKNMPTIITLQGVFEDKIFGKIISGDIKQNKVYYLMPDNKKVFIKSYEKNGKSVSLKISNFNKSKIENKLLTDDKNSVLVSDLINAKMFFIRRPEKDFYISFLGRKYKATLNYKGNKKKLLFINESIKLEEKIAYQNFNKIKELGRFAIYDKNLNFNGLGII